MGLQYLNRFLADSVLPYWAIILIVIAVLIVLISVILLLFLANFFFKSSFARLANDKKFPEFEDEEHKNTRWRKWVMESPREKVNFKTSDGLNLVGYFYKSTKPHYYAILVHGYHGRYYSLDRQAEYFNKLGFNVLMYNNRAHDESDGKYLTLGYKEKDDLKMIINEVIKWDKDAQIFVYGVSMGAFITMMALDKNAPANVKCGIEDCGYSSIESELKHQLISLNLKAKKFIYFVGKTYTKLFYHYDLKTNTADSLKETKIPFLFIHGALDEFVPINEVKINYEVHNKDVYKELVIYPLAGHNESYSVYNEDYEKTLYNFLKRYFELDENQ